MTSCRACQSRHLYLFLPLGAHPLANGFLREDQLAEAELLFPLDVYVCLDCGLIQISDNVPPNFFRQYVYVPSVSRVMQKHFAGLADGLVSICSLSAKSLTVDIGCNDGLFLDCLKKRGVRTLGIDPATNIVQMAEEKGLEVINEYFCPKIAAEVRAKYGPAAVVVTTNTYHHIGDLDSFTEGVTILLGDDGVFMVEVPYALEIVKLNQFDGIYHEHVSQFTVKSLVDHFRRFGMEIFRIDALEVHGGSIRVFARKARSSVSISSAVAEWVAEEEAHGLFAASTYDAFRDRVEKNKEALRGLLQSLKAQGKKVVGYGASARGNTLLNYYRIGT